MLEAAAAAGLDTIDTARAYGDAEALIGQLASAERWRVVTKLDHSTSVAASLATSAAALRRDPLDTVLLHDASLADDLEELALAQERGAVARIGISPDNPQQAEAALADDRLEVVQVAASLLDQRLVRGGWFERAATRGLEVFVRSIYLQGVAHLPVDALPPHLAPVGGALARIDEWAAARGLNRVDAFFHYSRSLGGVTLVVGCETLGQLQDNLSALAREQLSASELEELAALVGELPDEVLTPSAWPQSSAMPS
ncbi:MAG: hypothetical protein QOJ29_2894 [Thermoleophilaceae bacterium]|jgi:aryl-alcohol dehydrogenase-like predicted oxidoreductase|nr:hypothetical protein [Thermoleophilaceae bacterium]